MDVGMRRLHKEVREEIQAASERVLIIVFGERPPLQGLRRRLLPRQQAEGVLLSYFQALPLLLTAPPHVDVKTAVGKTVAKPIAKTVAVVTAQSKTGTDTRSRFPSNRETA